MKKNHKNIFQTVRKPKNNIKLKTSFFNPKAVSSNSLFSLNMKNNKITDNSDNFNTGKMQLNVNQIKKPLQNSLNLNLPNNLIKSFVSNHGNIPKPKIKALMANNSRKLKKSENIEEFDNEAPKPKIRQEIKNAFKASKTIIHERSKSYNISNKIESNNNLVLHNVPMNFVTREGISKNYSFIGEFSNHIDISEFKKELNNQTKIKIEEIKKSETIQGQLKKKRNKLFRNWKEVFCLCSSKFFKIYKNYESKRISFMIDFKKIKIELILKSEKNTEFG